MDKCQSSLSTFFSVKVFGFCLELTNIQYLVSDDPPNSLFGENLWVVVMIVFGVAVIFVTIGLVIVTIAKRRNNMDDNQEDHDFDR